MPSVCWTGASSLQLCSSLFNWQIITVTITAHCLQALLQLCLSYTAQMLKYVICNSIMLSHFQSICSPLIEQVICKASYSCTSFFILPTPLHLFSLTRPSPIHKLTRNVFKRNLLKLQHVLKSCLFLCFVVVFGLFLLQGSVQGICALWSADNMF